MNILLLRIRHLTAIPQGSVFHTMRFMGPNGHIFKRIPWSKEWVQKARKWAKLNRVLDSRTSRVRRESQEDSWSAQLCWETKGSNMEKHVGLSARVTVIAIHLELPWLPVRGAGPQWEALCWRVLLSPTLHPVITNDSGISSWSRLSQSDSALWDQEKARLSMAGTGNIRS